MSASHRYVAYTSDVGESFRPVAHPTLVSFAYGVSWLYIGGDVAYESWKARLKQKGLYYPGLQPWDPIPKVPKEKRIEAAKNARDWKIVTVERIVFQSVASMMLPAFLIHSAVRYSGKWLKNIKNARIRMYGPVGVGLSVVPILPYFIDEPVEYVVGTTFKKIEGLIEKPNLE